MSFKCSNCGNSTNVTDKMIHPLSGNEKAICIKEGLGLDNVVKILCPNCGISTLTQKSIPSKTKKSWPWSRKTDHDLSKRLSDQGISLFEQGNTASAIEKWEQAIDAEKTWAIPPFNLARAYADKSSQKSELKKAEKYLKRALKLAKKNRYSEDRQVLSQYKDVSAWIKTRKSQV